MNKIYRMLEQGRRSRNESAAWRLIYILYILLILSCLASGLRCLRFLLFNLNSKPQTRNFKRITRSRAQNYEHIHL
jgi:hypothetical protein